MNPSEAYIELLNRAYNQSRQDGAKSYPVASFEITLLAHAQQRAAQKENDLFRQLCNIFDWQLTRQQQNQYLKSLKNGLTLVITDLSRTILWTSQSILAMTGYSPAELLGQTPRILQGDKTDNQATSLIRHNLKQETSVKADLLNYRKNGEPYVCRITIDPLRNSQGELTHFLAVESEIK